MWQIIRRIIKKKQFFNNLNQEIQLAVEKDVKKIFCEIGEEKVYAIALVTDSDCITLYMAINTYEYMKKKDEQYIKMLEGRVPEEKIKRVKEGSDSFTKWIPAEWGYSDDKNSELTKISRKLYQKEEANPTEYAQYKSLFFETVTSSFKEIIEKNIFGTNAEETTYFVSISDGEGIYEIENYSAKLLNSDTIFEQFLNRMNREE